MRMHRSLLVIVTLFEYKPIQNSFSFYTEVHKQTTEKYSVDPSLCLPPHSPHVNAVLLDIIASQYKSLDDATTAKLLAVIIVMPLCNIVVPTDATLPCISTIH
jgi:hypothetical protein